MYFSFPSWCSTVCSSVFVPSSKTSGRIGAEFVPVCSGVGGSLAGCPQLVCVEFATAALYTGERQPIGAPRSTRSPTSPGCTRRSRSESRMLQHRRRELRSLWKVTREDLRDLQFFFFHTLICPNNFSSFLGFSQLPVPLLCHLWVLTLGLLQID